MRFVSLPAGQGWHFVNIDEIVAVKHAGHGKACTVLLTGGITLECTEETHAIHKRIDDRMAQHG